MGTTIDLRTIVQNGDAHEEGMRLADILLSRSDVEWEDLTIETHRLPIKLFNASFFLSFLRRIFAARPELLDAARRARWSSPYTAVFAEVVPRLMGGFHPAALHAADPRRAGALS